MKRFAVIPAIALGLGLAALTIADEQEKEKGPKPLKVLLIAGGCCHDYATQKELLRSGIEERVKATVDVEYTADKTTKATFSRYQEDNWAEGYDVVVHDECSSNVNNKEYVNRILEAHRQGVPAVNLHCAMHSYRWGDFRKPVKLGQDNAHWFEMIGLQSTGHGPKLPIEVTFTDKKHPITVGMSDWKTGNEELYNNVQVFESAHPLATGRQMVPPRKKKGQPIDPEAKPREDKAVVVWTNEYGPKKTKIFSTSLGHFNETVADDRYLDLVARGLLWATDHLSEDGTAKDGFGNE